MTDDDRARNVLWLLAHPDHRSLSHALCADGVAYLRALGHGVHLVDLHADGFDPVLTDADTEPGAATLSARQRDATEHATLPPEILRHQDAVRAADILIVQFPLWWYGMPAILKGWFDRVFTNGFAFGIRDAAGRVRKYGDGGLAGRRLLPIVTAGDRATALGPRGNSGDLEDVLWPLLHGTAHYTGMAPLRPHLVASVHHRGDALAETAPELRARLNGAFAEEPLRYRTLTGGDYGADHALAEHIAPNATGFAIHRAGCDPLASRHARDHDLRTRRPRGDGVG
ncbi:flavodoxin family protein [Rhodococcus rhodnii]|uniref:Flavodoxin family protein n=2 Tax=Rhodococcus rhodnii TaxID=38312 RepID=A0A6P2CKG9_9NOCA|nr:NAD(P)H-dependent oxidoreductase [Rhodococcus rhodnii]EOM74629.1 putative NAD(P)H dehydrogenase (quinone) [Rhodococcus rhodnii LMG 5362]TXG92360.1 flavodoxin family protein [Rhodococcus rhodnii]